MDILEFIKQEHGQLKLEITTMSEERKIKEKYLQMSLDESIQNETFLKAENKILQKKAENTRQRFLQLSETFKDAKEELTRLQTSLHSQTRDTYAARSKICHIVSYLQQLTDFQFIREGMVFKIFKQKLWQIV